MSEARTISWLRRLIGGAALLLACLLPVGLAQAHQIGTSYESLLASVQPAVPGLEIRVVPGAGELVAVNRSDRRLVVDGYEREPYLRIDPDGGVWINQRSPARFLNEDTYAAVELPEEADAKAAPEWKRVATDGSWTWHDHRIHWMSPQPPPGFKDKTERTKIFDWKVPFTAGGERGTISGSLWWVGSSKVSQLASLIVFVACALLILLGAVLWRRRRREFGPDDADSAAEEGAAAEKSTEKTAATGEREVW